jgi:hypothetical protein
MKESSIWRDRFLTTVNAARAQIGKSGSARQRGCPTDRPLVGASPLGSVGRSVVPK